MDLSVVVPLYNEEECVEPFVDELMGVLKGLHREFEVILVDDGSTDSTPQKIRESMARFPGRIRHIELLKNTGQTAAFDAGFQHVQGQWVITLDGDMQIDPQDIPLLLEHAGPFDVVHGWRRDRHDSYFKKLQTSIANRVRNRLTRSTVHDTGCPLKIFRRKVIETFKLFTGMHRFFVTLAQMEGFSTRGVVIRHRHRHAGMSKYGMLNRIFRSLRDLFAMRWMMSRHYRLKLRERL
jgi:glycosyltransferase involved in cell wall biosynthesis